MLGRCTVRLLEDYSIGSLPSSIASLLLGVGSLGDYSIASLPSGVGSSGCSIVETLYYCITSVGCWVVVLFDCWKTIVLGHFRRVLGHFRRVLGRCTV